MSETTEKAQANGQKKVDSVTNVGSLTNGQLSPRSIKAIGIILDGDIELLNRKGARVKSSNGGGEYIVASNFCTCPDFQYRNGVTCKHVRAYRTLLVMREADLESEFKGSEEEEEE